MNLSANERLSLGAIRLKIGDVTEKVTVEAVGAAVQTASSERAAQLTSNQINMVLVRGRDVLSLLRLLPGVSNTSDPNALGDGTGAAMPYIQGQQYQFNTFNVDGVAGNDLGNPYAASSSTNMDAIGEVTVLLNNYQAEYGRNGGAFINIVTKSGTRDFHGTGYWYKRHEMFNANDFFSNRNGVPKALYRYNTLGRHHRRTALHSEGIQHGSKTSCFSFIPLRIGEAILPGRSRRSPCPPRSSGRGISRRRST